MMSRLEIVTHIGTHIDAPCHFIDGTWSIDEVPLDFMVNKGRVIPLTHKQPMSPVTADDILATSVDFDSSVIPILHTGWTDRAWGTDRLWNEMIYLDTSAAAVLVDRGLSVVASVNLGVSPHIAWKLVYSKTASNYPVGSLQIANTRAGDPSRPSRRNGTAARVKSSTSIALMLLSI